MSPQTLTSAGQYYKKHEVVLGPESEFVRMARPGDRVVLWARALYAVSRASYVERYLADVAGMAQQCPVSRSGMREGEPMLTVSEASLSIYTTPFPPGG